MAQYQIACPIKGTWQVHRPGQRPVEGTAVYKYRNGLVVCEEHGIYCFHVSMVRDRIKELPEEAIA